MSGLPNTTPAVRKQKVMLAMTCASRFALDTVSISMMSLYDDHEAILDGGPRFEVVCGCSASRIKASICRL